jgi:hypothetical protein
MVGPHRSVSARTRLEAGSDRHQRAPSASCVGAMAWISVSWWYILSTPSTVAGGKALRVLAMAASVCPSPLTVGRGSHSLALSWGDSEVHH